MEQREELLSRVCEKYDDPGRWAAGVLCTTVIIDHDHFKGGVQRTL